MNMIDLEEKFLTPAGLIARLNEAGISANRQTIYRWMKRDNPVTHHRPEGPTGKIYFLWSEVYAWLKTACLTPAPDKSNDSGQAA